MIGIAMRQRSVWMNAFLKRARSWKQRETLGSSSPPYILIVSRIFGHLLKIARRIDS